MGGTDVTVDGSGIFTDPNGDTLTLSAISADESIATVIVNGTSIVIHPVALGTVNLTVTAEDGKGGTVSDSFSVTVIEKLIRLEQPAGTPLVKNTQTPQSFQLTVEIMETIQVSNIQMEFTNVNFSSNADAVWYMFGNLSGAILTPSYISISYNNGTLPQGTYTISVPNGISSTGNSSTGTVQLIINGSTVETTEFTMN